MKLKTRLNLNSYISLGVILLMIVSLAWSFREESIADQFAALVVEMRNTAFERTVLRDEYLLHQEERARIQWEAKTEDLRLLIDKAEEQLPNNYDRELLKEIKKNFDSTNSIFSRITKSRKTESPPGNAGAFSLEGEKRLTNQLFVKEYGLIDAIGRLQKSASQVSVTAQNRVLLFLVIFIVILVIFTIGNSVLVNRVIAERLAVLRKGTEVIGSGDLGHCIDIKGDDELSELARASNEMAGKLKASHTSVKNLQREVDERKRAEEEVLRLNAELEQRVLDRTAELEVANRELEGFSYSVSHDLRAPLRHIAGFSELLIKKAPAGLDEKSRHYLNVISDSASQMGKLVDDLLSFSRMGRTEMLRTGIDLDMIVSEAVEAFKKETGGRDIEWKVGSFPHAYGDKVMLKIVFENLLSNALKFTRPRAQAMIEIGCISDQPHELTCYVRDNGVGFDMKYVDKLFGLFQRLHRPEEFEGTGLGLANVRRIIHRHGGRTWAEGVVNDGAAIFFSLPNIEEK